MIGILREILRLGSDLTQVTKRATAIYLFGHPFGYPGESVQLLMSSKQMQMPGQGAQVVEA